MKIPLLNFEFHFANVQKLRGHKIQYFTFRVIFDANIEIKIFPKFPTFRFSVKKSEVYQ